MKSLNYFGKVVAILLLLFVTYNIAISQSESGRMSFGFNGGGVKYWGEFTDNQFWLGGDVFLRYNIFSRVSRI